MLTPRKRAFADHLLICGNAAEAARRAGYSAKTASAQGSRLSKDVAVQQALAEAKRRMHDTAGITAEQITAELAKIGFADIEETPKLGHKLKALELLIRHVTTQELEARITALEEELAHRKVRYAV